jgi:hypothetical protein
MSIPAEKITYLHELIRKVNQYLNPGGSLEDYEYLYNKDLKDRLYGKNPKCFLKIKGIGRDTSDYLVPICNRAGIVDPQILSISIKAIKKIMTDEVGEYDINTLTQILTRLQRMHSTYSQDIPKPPDAAGRKANVSRMFNNISKMLDVYKGN